LPSVPLFTLGQSGSCKVAGFAGGVCGRDARAPRRSSAAGCLLRRSSVHAWTERICKVAGFAGSLRAGRPRSKAFFGSRVPLASVPLFTLDRADPARLPASPAIFAAGTPAVPGVLRRPCLRSGRYALAIFSSSFVSARASARPCAAGGGCGRSRGSDGARCGTPPRRTRRHPAARSARTPSSPRARAWGVAEVGRGERQRHSRLRRQEDELLA